MSSSASDVESLTTARASPVSAVMSKWKIALSVVLLLGAVAAIGVCAAVVVATTNGGQKGKEKKEGSRSVEGLTINEIENDIRNGRGIPGYSDDPPPRDSCYSDALNNTLPAAHIKGSGNVWEVKDGNYVSQWDCNGSLQLAYVSGGMWFQQEDKSLYVPKCGWYYISSQIAFQSRSRRTQTYTHTLKVDRNCNSDRNAYSHSTFATAGSHTKTSTFVGDIVKICAGGRIYVNIPSAYNACCPRGEETVTSLTAHLVSESDCQWPIRSYKEPKEPLQRPSE